MCLPKGRSPAKLSELKKVEAIRCKKIPKGLLTEQPPRTKHYLIQLNCEILGQPQGLPLHWMLCSQIGLPQHTHTFTPSHSHPILLIPPNAAIQVIGALAANCLIDIGLVNRNFGVGVS